MRDFREDEHREEEEEEVGSRLSLMVVVDDL